jgi:hypothetical protein
MAAHLVDRACTALCPPPPPPPAAMAALGAIAHLLSPDLLARALAAVLSDGTDLPGDGAPLEAVAVANTAPDLPEAPQVSESPPDAVLALLVVLVLMRLAAWAVALVRCGLSRWRRARERRAADQLGSELFVAHAALTAQRVDAAQAREELARQKALVQLQAARIDDLLYLDVPASASESALATPLRRARRAST